MIDLQLLFTAGIISFTFMAILLLTIALTGDNFEV